MAISPAQMRGILILPPAQLKTAFPVLSKPSNKSKAVALTADQFAKGFGNALERSESDALWAQWNIPSPARPLFQGAAANFNPKTEAAVDTKAARGPLLIIGAGQDHTVPASVSRAAFKRYAQGHHGERVPAARRPRPLTCHRPRLGRRRRHRCGVAHRAGALNPGR